MAAAPSTPSSIRDCLASLINNPDYSDVIFYVGADKTKMYAWRGLLCSRSEVFRTMFSSSFAETAEGPPYTVTIPNIEPDVFLELLRYIYTDTAIATEDTVFRLLAAADQYMLEGLKVLCCDQLSKHLTGRRSDDTALLSLAISVLRRIARFSDTAHALEKVAVQCLTIVGKRMDALLASDEWRNLEEDVVVRIVLYCSGMENVDELKLFHGVLAWGTAELERRRESSNHRPVVDVDEDGKCEIQQAVAQGDLHDQLRRVVERALHGIHLEFISGKDLLYKVQPTRVIPPEMMLEVYSRYVRGVAALPTSFMHFHQHVCVVVPVPNMYSLPSVKILASRTFTFRGIEWFMSCKVIGQPASDGASSTGITSPLLSDSGILSESSSSAAESSSITSPTNSGEFCGVYLNAKRSSPLIAAGAKVVGRGISVYALHEQRGWLQVGSCDGVSFCAGSTCWGWNRWRALAKLLASPPSSSGLISPDGQLTLAVVFPRAAEAIFE